jgi:hypothetical protein
MVTSLGSLWTCLLCCPLGPWGQELRPVTPDTTEALCTAQHMEDVESIFHKGSFG